MGYIYIYIIVDVNNVSNILINIYFNLQLLRKNFDGFSRCELLMKEMGYWQHIRVQFCGAAIAFTACLVCSFTTSNAGIAGLVINFAIIINFYLGGWVYLIAESEAFLTSVERIGEYCDMDQEAARYVVEPFNKKNSNEWPLYGEVQFMDVCLRYRKDLPLALKNATFKVNKGTSTGVVGRTGAGKSTLAVALFRLFEIESGKILIDGVDIQKLGLMDVRRKLSIVSYIFLYSHKSIILVEKIFSNIPYFFIHNAHCRFHKILFYFQIRQE